MKHFNLEDKGPEVSDKNQELYIAVCCVRCTLPCVQDMMSVPGKITAMENWGLSMYNRQAPASID